MGRVSGGIVVTVVPTSFSRGLKNRVSGRAPALPADETERVRYPPAVDPVPAETSLASAPRQRLTLFDTTCIIVGIIIGEGFFESPPRIAASAGSVPLLLGLWVAGGFVAFVGALCYAELAGAYPKDGGEYVFISRAFGDRLGFLYAWAWFWVVRPGNLGAMAYVFARYADELLPLPLGRHAFAPWAVGSLLVLTVINVLGVRAGKSMQNLLTAAKVLGLVAVFAVALWGVPPAGGMSDAPVAPPTASGVYLASILIMWVYGGWNDMSYVAAEVRDPRRNILRALVLGTLAVVAIYLAGNYAFIRALGFEGFTKSGAVAADVMRLRFGAAGARFISALVCVSCLGALNGMILTGSRIYYAVGNDHPMYAWLGKWDARRDTPARALWLQAAATLALVAGLGLDRDAFERMVVFTEAVFWSFLLLAGLSLFVLRFREPQMPRPYRVAGYPLTPALFCAACVFMVYASARYAWSQRTSAALWAIGLTGVGVVASFVSEKRERGDRWQRTHS
jgi:amino acid transporter